MTKYNKFKFEDSDIEDIITLEKDDTLYLHDLDCSFCIFSDGRIVLAYESFGGTGAALKLFATPGVIIGGYAFFLEDEYIDNFFFIALERTILKKISKERSRELLDDKSFLTLLLETMAKGSFSLIKDLIYRSDRSVEKFLAYVLLKYSVEGIFKVRSLSRFSEYMKCSRSNLYNAIQKLVNSGVIKKDGTTLTIIDREALEEISES